MFAFLNVERNVLTRIIFFKFSDFPFDKNSAPNAGTLLSKKGRHLLKTGDLLGW